MLHVLRQQVEAEHLACVFDAKGKTFRDDLYSEYKANRTAMPDDLGLQIGPIHEAVRALGWPIIEIEGIEADDVIATLARRASEQAISNSRLDQRQGPGAARQRARDTGKHDEQRKARHRRG